MHTTHPSIPPIAPSTVFFGLIVGQSLCLPRVLPAKYAKVSVDHAETKINHILRYPNSCCLINSICKKKILMYIVPAKDNATSEKEQLLLKNTIVAIKTNTYEEMNRIMLLLSTSFLNTASTKRTVVNTKLTYITGARFLISPVTFKNSYTPISEIAPMQQPITVILQ